MTINPGIYDHVAAGAYHADQLDDNEPSINASILKVLIRRSPKHAWTCHPRLNPDWQPQVHKKFDVGSAAHEIFLMRNPAAVAVISEVANAKGVRMPAKDWKTDDAQAQRDIARANGLIPLLQHEYEQVQEMLEAIREQLPKLQVTPPMFEDGQPEQTLIWRDRGVLCRARLDWLHNNTRFVDDLKTCRGSAAPLDWASRTLWGMQGEIQAQLTVRGIRHVFGHDAEFRFLAVETRPPYAMAPVRLGPHAVEMADRQIDQALDLWARCLREDRWPSYPPRIVDADPPSWALWEASDLEDLAEAAA